MTKLTDQIEKNPQIADPKFKAALVQAATALEKLSPDAAERLGDSIQRETTAVQRHSDGGQIARELVRNMDMYPDALKGALPGLVGNEAKAKALVAGLDKANLAFREGMEPKSDGSLHDIVFGPKPIEGEMVPYLARPRKDAMADIADAIKETSKTAITPLPTPADAASAPKRHK